MKMKLLIGLLLIQGLLCGFLAGCVSEQEKKGGLEAKAKISREEAAKIALSRVPDGTISQETITEELGRLVWAFNITTQRNPGNTKLVVDATTGTVVAVDVDHPAGTTK
jgi:uncharacterized membrane protein YkoI